MDLERARGVRLADPVQLQNHLTRTACPGSGRPIVEHRHRFPTCPVPPCPVPPCPVPPCRVPPKPPAPPANPPLLPVREPDRVPVACRAKEICTSSPLDRPLVISVRLPYVSPIVTSVCTA